MAKRGRPSNEKKEKLAKAKEYYQKKNQKGNCKKHKYNFTRNKGNPGT